MLLIKLENALKIIEKCDNECSMTGCVGVCVFLCVFEGYTGPMAVVLLKEYNLKLRVFELWGDGDDDDGLIGSGMTVNNGGLFCLEFYIEVGDQKFISRSSDGLALITFGTPAAAAAAADDDDFDFDGMLSSPSSLICDDATDVVDDMVSRCMPNRLDKNQPR